MELSIFEIRKYCWSITYCLRKESGKFKWTWAMGLFHAERRGASCSCSELTRASCVD